MKIPAVALIAALTLTACEQAEPASVQRVTLDQAQPNMPVVPLNSPDTSLGYWSVDESGQSIHFGNTDEDPLLTLNCRLQQDPPQLAIIRHAPARPGLTALFPIVGNGMRSRFSVDAQLRDGEWLWEGTVAADDPKLDVFTGPRQLLATLPGGGMLDIQGSRIPGEFVNWCRAGGAVLQAVANEEEGVIRNEYGDIVE